MHYKTIDQSLFKRNREKLIKKLKRNSIAIINSNNEMHRTGDQNFRFRQNSNMFYLTGINQEQSILIILPGYQDKKLKEVLFIRKSSEKVETWEGHKLTFEEARKASGIETIKWLDELDAFLKERLMAVDTIYVDIQENQKYTSDTIFRGEKFYNELKNQYPLHNYERLFPVISELRMIKEPEEIELIKKACSITKDGFIRILKFVKPGVMEYQVEAEIAHEFFRQGASEFPYPPIIASGLNACTLHYIANNKLCIDGDMILMDFAAEYANYSSDLSRTIPVNGTFTKRQKQLYEATLRVFKYAKSLMKPCTTINKVHKEVCKKWEEEHIQLGLYTKDDVKKSPKDSPLWAKYYMHGTSHFMGLDVHDVGNKDDEFLPGMVLTCEPAIYIPDEKIGIRIENDVLITEKGNIDLMEDIPVEPAEIEKLMRKKN